MVEFEIRLKFELVVWLVVELWFSGSLSRLWCLVLSYLFLVQFEVDLVRSVK